MEKTIADLFPDLPIYSRQILAHYIVDAARVDLDIEKLEGIGHDLCQRIDHLSTMGAALANDVPMVSNDAPDVITSHTRPARGLGPGGPLGGVSTPSAWGGAGGAPGGPGPHAAFEPPAMFEYELEDDDEESLAGDPSHSSLASRGKQRQPTDHTSKLIEMEEQYDHPLMKRIFSSRVQTRLWDRFAKASGWSTWHDIPSSDRQDMLEKFETTFATYSPTLLGDGKFRLTGGWELFLRDTMGLQTALWDNPWSAPTEEFWNPHIEENTLNSHHAMALLATTADDAMTGVFINATHNPSPLVADLQALDRHIRSFQEFKIVLLIKRDESLPWNSWVAAWEQKGRAFNFAVLPSLQMRRYKPDDSEQWTKIAGPWEWYVFRSGVGHVGAGIDQFSFCDAMKYLVGKKNKASWSTLPVLSDPENTHVSGFSVREVQKFWEEWDAVAERRDALLKNVSNTMGESERHTAREQQTAAYMVSITWHTKNTPPQNNHFGTCT